jgi:hypothetical protein
MALALKNHTPISTRSPYFINCEPAAGTIVSASLSVTVQLGDRRSSVTSMTDVKNYTLSKTNAVDGIIVFDIAAIIKDFFEHEYLKFLVLQLVPKASNEGQVYFVKVVKSIVNTTGTEADETTYYTIKDGYGSFKNGVNYLPSTGATGNYPFTSPIAYGTDVTIMATNCYRQIGQNSYATLGINTGEFDRHNSESASFARIKFGAGEDWKTDVTANTNCRDINIAAVESSSARYGEVGDSLLYTPIGKVNLLNNWIIGFDYLRVGHFVSANEMNGNASSELVTVLTESDFSWSAGAFTFSIDAWTTGSPIINVNDQLTMTLPAFTGCSQTFVETSETVQVTFFDGDFITVITQDQSFDAQMECVATTIPSTPYQLKLLVPIVQSSNTIASINKQPVLRYEIICEPKYNVIDCLFINKWGCWDSFSFIKKSMQKLAITSSQYKRSVGFVDRGPLGTSTPKYSYSLTDHQKVQYNKNGIKSITVNTGFVDESFNLLLEEMMLSERVYLIIDDVVEPVVLNTQNVDFKTSVNDKLINYEVGFEFAYNQIQSAI